MESLNIILNGKSVKAKVGETVLGLAQRYGYEIPTLCHDPRLKPFSSCYVCVVKIENLKGLQPSCSTVVFEGMNIETESEEIFKARQTALNLMLSNHYADCVAPCKLNCPAGVDVQGYISLIDKGLYKDALALIKETNPLPAICGRVCVRPCEFACRRNFLDEGAAVGVDYMKRFIADKDLNSTEHYKPELAKSTNKKVAIIGAGPGGLSAAYFLQQKGHQCDIFEAAPKAGGWLRYGIPEYRLPNEIIDKEIETITELGVNIFCNKKLGENLSYNELKENYNAVILTIGSQKGTLARVEGEDALNVFSGIEFLRNMAITGKTPDFRGKKVIVVGGGNTAMDCCRTAVRCGAEDVKVVYRRTENEMPANPIEIHESKVEGVEYLFLTNPQKINKNNKGEINSITCVRMELGEPDSSGRRSPVVVQNSEFDIEADILLAAIGQKTEVSFLENVNSSSGNQQLSLNKWGDIKVNPQTFETDIKGVFSAGDCVSGPATIIEAIAQAKTASKYCHAYLSGENVEDNFEFFSKKEYFKKLEKHDFEGKYKTQFRNEMPVLESDKRFNFEEVELGYQDENIVKNEASRCLECGCSALYNCKLKDLAGTYKVDQNKFAGDFKEYNVDFSHPLIEFDNNKCILCGKCVRICDEIVGAKALGFINRGFDTYVAPSMDLPLSMTHCESCGLCISVCPTAAISENKIFKPGPVKTKKISTFCSFCSLGCEIEIQHLNGFIYEINGVSGQLNYDSSICGKGKFGYRTFNNANRITKPLLKVEGNFVEVSWNKAIEVLIENVSNSKSENSAIFAGSALTNEEMYLIQKFSRTVLKTNNVTSFHYIESGKGYHLNTDFNLEFEKIQFADRIYLLGSEVNFENPLVGFEAMKAKNKNNAKIEIITTLNTSKLEHKADSVLKIVSYFHFMRAVNFYILKNELFNKTELAKLKGFDNYLNSLLQSNYSDLLSLAGVDNDSIKKFVEGFLSTENSVLIFSEEHLNSSASQEVLHFSKLVSVESRRIIALKRNFNSLGLNKMGICKKNGPGNQRMDNEVFVEKMKKIWNVSEIPEVKDFSLTDYLHQGKIKNLFVFQEDPLGCSTVKEKTARIFENTEFVCVQDFYLTPTARQADLVLPAEYNYEKEGSFYNTFNQLLSFEKQLDSKIEVSNFELFNLLFAKFGIKKFRDFSEINEEIGELVSLVIKEFQFSSELNNKPLSDYRFSCTSVNRLVNEEVLNIKA